jgi:hypothetical protein
MKNKPTNNKLPLLNSWKGVKCNVRGFHRFDINTNKCIDCNAERRVVNGKKV